MVECSFKTHTKVTTMATNVSTSNKLTPHPYYVKRRLLKDDDEGDEDVERWYPEGWWGAQDGFHGHEEESEDEGEGGCVDDDDRAFGGRRRFSDAEEEESDEEDERNGYGWGEQEQEQEQEQEPVPLKAAPPHYKTYRIESWHWYQRTAPSTEHTIEHYNASCERRAHWVEPHVMFLRDNVTKVKGFYFYGNGFPMENLAETEGYVDVRTGKKYASSQALFEDIK
jgi:hypothetical protein